MGIRALRWSGWFTQAWTKQQPVPLDMTDTEILDWLANECDQAVYTRPTWEVAGGWSIHSGNIKAKHRQLRDAVCLAAAMWKEANR